MRRIFSGARFGVTKGESIAKRSTGVPSVVTTMGVVCPKVWFTLSCVAESD